LQKRSKATRPRATKTSKRQIVGVREKMEW
jgi:hypothetical protein